MRELKPRLPKSYKFYGQKTVNEIDIDNKIIESRQFHGVIRPRFPPPTPKKKFPSPTTIISSLKPRFYHARHNFHRRVLPLPKNNVERSGGAQRRSSNGDHRYVSFYRGQIGGKSWGYSYRLWNKICHCLSKSILLKEIILGLFCDLFLVSYLEFRSLLNHFIPSLSCFSRAL